MVASSSRALIATCWKLGPKAEPRGEGLGVERVAGEHVLAGGLEAETVQVRHLGRREGPLDDLGLGVELPGRLRQARAAEHLDAVAGARQAHRDLAQGLLGEHHRRHDLEIGEHDLVVAHGLADAGRAPSRRSRHPA